MQLRNFRGGAGAVVAKAGELAFFSEPKAEASALALFGEVPTNPITAGDCDILYCSRIMVANIL